MLEGGSGARIPRGVWVLGFVSLLMDTSSELIHALLPLYMVDALGASVLVVGFIEGIAEAIALVVKVFSGYWSDVFRQRKPAVLLGTVKAPAPARQMAHNGGGKKAAGPVTQEAPAAAPLPTVEVIRGDKRSAEVIK